jgi:hypothetical protein
VAAQSSPIPPAICPGERRVLIRTLALRRIVENSRKVNRYTRRVSVATSPRAKLADSAPSCGLACISRTHESRTCGSAWTVKHQAGEACSNPSPGRTAHCDRSVSSGRPSTSAEHLVDRHIDSEPQPLGDGLVGGKCAALRPVHGHGVPAPQSQLVAPVDRLRPRLVRMVIAHSALKFQRPFPHQETRLRNLTATPQ